MCPSQPRIPQKTDAWYRERSCDGFRVLGATHGNTISGYSRTIMSRTAGSWRKEAASASAPQPTLHIINL